MPLERLPVQVTVSVNTGYDSNVNTTALDDQGSFFSSANVSLIYSFGTERTRVSTSTSASVSYYDSPDRSGVDLTLPELNLNLGVSHAVSERLSLSGSIRVFYGSEPDFSLELGQNRRIGNYFYTGDSISASYQWLERFSTVTSYSFGAILYEDEILSLLQDRFNHSFGQQVRFLFLPITTITADYSLGLVNYTLPNRNSTTYVLTGGLDQTIGPRLQGTLRVGATFRNSEQERTNTINPYFNGSLNYVVGEKTSVNWTARYSTEESDVIGTTSRNTFRTGLGATYGLTPRISSTLSMYYVRDGNNLNDSFFMQQSSFSEDSLDVALNLQYAVNPRLSITAGYRRTEILSDVSQRSYSRSSYSGGLTYSF